MTCEFLMIRILMFFLPWFARRSMVMSARRASVSNRLHSSLRNG